MDSIVILGIVALTMGCYAPFLRTPLYQDQSLHLYIGREWRRGRLPYRDYSFTPGPLLALVYRLGSRLADRGEQLFHWASALYVAVGNVFLFLCVEDMAGTGSGLCASVLYAAYVFSPRLTAYKFPLESYALTPNIIGFYFLVHACTVPSPTAALAAGAAFGAASLMRQSSFLYLPAGLAVMLLRCPVSASAWYLAGCVSMHLVWVVYFACKGALRDYLKSTVWYGITLVFFSHPEAAGKGRVDPVHRRGRLVVQMLRDNSLTIFPLYLLAAASVPLWLPDAVSTHIWMPGLFLLTSLVMIFPRMNLDCSYWINSIPWAAMLAGETLAGVLNRAVSPMHPDTVVALVLCAGFLVLAAAYDFAFYTTLDPEKRDMLYDPKKVNHASWWPTFNTIGDYVRANTDTRDRVLVLGHAARIYNRSQRRAFFHMPSFAPFRARLAGLESHRRFVRELKDDYPEVIVLAGHMPAYPFDPEPYMADLAEISDTSGIVYVTRHTEDKFPVLFADTDRSYLKAVLHNDFRNARLEREKDRISGPVRSFETHLSQAPFFDAFSRLICRLKAAGRHEDIIFSMAEMNSVRGIRSAGPHLESLLIAFGEAQFQTDSVEEAEATFRSIVELNSRSVDAHNNLAVIQFSRGNYSQATGLFRKVLSLDPNNTAARENIASMRGALGV